MKRTIYQCMLLAMVAMLAACEPNVDEFKPSNGSVDFSKFIAIGDSYTAGYTDGALGRRGQEESFSYILGKQLMYVGSESFNQPLVQSSSSVGSIELQPGVFNGYYELNVVDGALTPQPTLGDFEIYNEDAYSADNQNFGIPGAKLIHLGELPAGYPRYAQLNNFYGRFASSMEATVIGDALAALPTFVSLWIGNNDVLGYALAGGASDEITNPLIFDGGLTQMVNMITSTGAKVVLGNIPAVDAIPYFNTIPYNAMPVSQDVIDEFTPLLAGYNQLAAVKGYPTIELVVGNNPFFIYDSSIDLGLAGSGSPLEPFNNVRQATSEDKLLLTAKAAASASSFMAYPVLPDQYVLTQTELKNISDATTAYNITIAGLESDNVAVVDLASMMTELSTTGLYIDGNRYTSTFVTGGVFSLDGIHATGRGSAIIANAFIDAINTKFNASVPRANINDYDMVKFP